MFMSEGLMTTGRTCLCLLLLIFLQMFLLSCSPAVDDSEKAEPSGQEEEDEPDWGEWDEDDDSDSDDSDDDDLDDDDDNNDNDDDFVDDDDDDDDDDNDDDDTTIELKWDDGVKDEQLGAVGNGIFVNMFDLGAGISGDLLSIKIMFSSDGFGGSPPPNPYDGSIVIVQGTVAGGPVGSPVFFQYIQPVAFDVFEEYTLQTPELVSGEFGVGWMGNGMDFESVGTDYSTTMGAFITLDGGATWTTPLDYGFSETFMIRAVVQPAK